ncbi:MAG: hypothetical protein FJW37_15410 [Acidobacteria bacterium]|nr:hypothetical protein [Acidobacteriota bacterium]
MPAAAKLYIALVIALGMALLGASAAQTEIPDLTRYLSYLALAIFCSTLKIKLPGFTGNISMNFLFILVAISELSLPETVTQAGAGALIQSLWKPKRRPKPVQVAFNMATLVLASGIAYLSAQTAIEAAGSSFLPLVLAVGAGLYFVMNTLAVAWVVSLVESKSLIQTWRQCHLWAFPYYLLGSLAAALISYSSRTIGWQLSLLILPAMYLVYSYYRLVVERALAQGAQATAKAA